MAGRIEDGGHACASPLVLPARPEHPLPAFQESIEVIARRDDPSGLAELRKARGWSPETYSPAPARRRPAPRPAERTYPMRFEAAKDHANKVLSRAQRDEEVL